MGASNRSTTVITRIRGDNASAYLIRRDGVYHLRWKDPTTGRLRSQSCATRDRSVAEMRLRLKARALRNERDEALHRQVAGLPPPPPPMTLRALGQARIDRLRKAPNRPAKTVYDCAASMHRLCEFAEAQGVEHVSGLDAALLGRFYAHISERGLAMSTVNQYLRPARAALLAAVEDGLAPALTVGMVKRQLPMVSLGNESARELYGLFRAEALERTQLKALLRQSMSLDPRVAVDVLTKLLFGLRRIELTRARVEHITDDGLRLPAEVCKGRRRRHVPAADFTPSGQTLLDVLRQRPQDEWLSTFNHQKMGRRFVALGIRGHVLRATCATYQLSLDVSLKHATARLGHTLAVADKAYLTLLGSQPKRATSLEQAMDIEQECSDIITLAKRLAVTPRNEARKPPKFPFRELTS